MNLYFTSYKLNELFVMQDDEEVTGGGYGNPQLEHVEENMPVSRIRIVMFTHCNNSVVHVAMLDATSVKSIIFLWSPVWLGISIPFFFTLVPNQIFLKLENFSHAALPVLH